MITPTTILEQKVAMLAKAEAMVAELRNQVATLRNATQPSEFETLLAAHTPNAVDAKPTQKLVLEPKIEREVAKLDGEKNEKGVVSKTILKVLSDGQSKTVDQVIIEANKLLDKPTTRGSVRGTLSNLSSANKVTKTAYGQYAIGPQEEESPAGVVATNDNGGAINVQSSPLTGPQ